MLKILWADFEQLPKGFSAIRDLPSVELHGARAWPLRLIKYVDGGEVVADYPWFEVELGRLWPTSDSGPLYEQVLEDFCLYAGLEPMGYEELLKLGFWYLEPRRIALHTWVADLKDRETYQNNLAAELALLKGRASSGPRQDGGGFAFSMSSGCAGCPVVETNEFVICDISFDSSNQTATITFESCNTHFYDVYSADDLTNAVWEFRTNLLGQADSTLWTDYDDLSTLTSRFYSVVRLASHGDPDEDGLANSQEALLGTNPYNRDTDGDGVLDGPFNTNKVAGVSYSLSGIPDAFPTDPTRSVDTDGDGLDDLTEDTDDDNDGIPDSSDPDPVAPISVAPFKTVVV